MHSSETDESHIESSPLLRLSEENLPTVAIPEVGLITVNEPK